MYMNVFVNALLLRALIELVFFIFSLVNFASSSNIKNAYEYSH